MGAVYKARQTSLDRFVAVKILPRETAGGATFAERFAREAKALARLDHPHIVGVHDFGEAAGLFYFVMEYVDGVNLRQMMRSGELSPREALAMVSQICEALQYAHDEGFVHRDIKPENILVDKRGRVKIADFGLTKLLGGGLEDFTLTRTQQVMGTPQYMAPEQIETPQQVDHRADIYSLGVVFYEMLTGELPIGRFEPPSHRVQVDVRLDEVVLKSLEKRPERRYQHASDVKTDVELIGGSKISPSPTSSAADAVSAKTTAPRLPRVWTVPAKALELFGLLAVGILIGYLIAAAFLDSVEVQGAIVQALVWLYALPVLASHWLRRQARLGASQGSILPSVAAQLDRPALILGAAAGMMLGFGLMLLVLFVFLAVQSGREVPSQFCNLLTIMMIPSLVVLEGAIQMRRAQSRRWALAGSIVALVPHSVMFIVLIPAGIWSLFVLSRRDVKAAFDAHQPPGGSERPPWTMWLRPLFATSRATTSEQLVVLFGVFACGAALMGREWLREPPLPIPADVEQWVEDGRLPAPEATQAAAADDRYVYAIANEVVAKYDRETGKRLGVSTGEASHLNAGFVAGGKMYCAHSNFPGKPEQSEIKILDLEKMALDTFKDFGRSDGSLTWAVKAHGAWWCNFAFYGAENHKTYLAMYDDEWRELGRWTYSPKVIKAFGENSASCGIWRGERLLVTGHDERELFVLELPEGGSVLRLVTIVPVPFTGQGFAADPVTGGLIGIDRPKRQIVFARRKNDRADAGNIPK
jgi:hypothetical protein